MKKFLLLLAVIMVFVCSCDRYEHDFKQTYTFETFELDFTKALSTGLLNKDLTNVLNFYSDDYLNNGVSKPEIKIKLKNIAQNITENIQINVNGTDKNFTYKITDTNINETFTDVVKNEGGKWILYGNQVQKNIKQPVLIQLITSTFCSNCPAAEEKLHAMQQADDELIYIEYQWWYAGMGDLNINQDIMDFYDINTAPNAIFNGSNMVSGSEAASLDLYSANANLASEVNAKMQLSNLQVIDVTKQKLIAKVFLDNFKNVSYTDLKLNAVIIDKNITNYKNYNNEPLHNTVIAKASKSLTSADDLNFVQFEVNLSTVHASLIEDGNFLPDDCTLVVWAQTAKTKYDAETCLIYYTVKTNIEKFN